MKIKMNEDKAVDIIVYILLALTGFDERRNLFLAEEIYSVQL